ncbi:DUF3604 domain-containing protein [Rhizobium calliandrae]|uniref:DUF3604 domain-containing protein n=2 Tax=Rhizobium calliandrae TaxID=1312182 RepID=A0ABT7KN69_9HYPH|nr:DUF3604 domain-containing protein [Rhizobium calliandrae]MDL2410076.1 DUF3604 domain-containing protein [Rhizobium calliandrae]
MTRMTIVSEGCFLLLLSVSFAGAQEANPLRDAYFGETHVHTSYSLDAWLFGNRMTDPGDAYKYFKGEPIKHPLGYDIKIDTPLDFAGVTDHSEYVGVVKLANDPGSAINKMSAAEPLILKNDSQEEVQRVYLYALKLLAGERINALLSPEIAHTVWEENIDFANKANEPGKFTAFCSYEWTSMPNNMNLHRNIFFKDCAHVPAAPFSALDSDIPSDLWKWMDDQRNQGNDLLAISHNANLSDGRMYPTEIDINGRPIDRAYAEDRMRNEPLIEIKQIKGASETHPLLSPTDEFANYEILTYLLSNPEGRIPHVIGSYARQALKDGLTLEDTKGFNPYKFGFGAASDSHNTGVPYRQNNFFGGHASLDGTIEKRMSGTIFAGMDPRLENPGGLTGVWAEENTRASIFNAMKRKETFAVSGPHIKVRFFGGWNYAEGQTADQRHDFWKSTPDWIKDRDWLKAAYAQGVPMGGDLTPPPAGDKPPSFAVWAVKDPTSGNLDRIQIVKGWTKSGQSFEKVFDVAWAGDRTPDKWTGEVPPIGSTVDMEKGTYTNSIGAVELKSVWTDPEFDQSGPAFYYARVLEIPTPRWTTIQAAQLGIAPPDVVPATIQERAWSSPIWYTPAPETHKLAKVGPTVDDLKKAGAVALDDAELKALVVDKTPWLQNNVTGTRFRITYSASGIANATQMLTPIDPRYVTSKLDQNQGQALADNVGRQALMPSATGDAAAASYFGTPSPYYINNGKLVTVLAGTPIEVTAYKLGDKVYGARSNEFGYVNYEIIPEVKELNPLSPGNEVLH